MRSRHWYGPIRDGQDKGGGAAYAALSLLAWRRRLGIRAAWPAQGPPILNKRRAARFAAVQALYQIELMGESADWGTAIVRRESKQPVDKGGWSAVFTTANGLDMQTPLLHFLRTTGEKAWFGWTNSPRIEELRAAWVDAPDIAAQKAIAADIQRQCWIDVPHLPVGIWYQPMAWQNTIGGVPDGFPLFWGVRRMA